MRIIFGGSFDPVHIGHIILARDILEYFKAKEVIFVPTYQAPLKNKHSASPEDRLNMLKIAIENETKFKVEDFEIRRKGISYTVYTLRYLKEKYREELYLLLGSDSFLKFHLWKESEEILKLAKIIIAEREGKLDEVREYIKRNFPHLVEGKDVFPVKIRRLDISSTEIRNRLAEGKSVYCLVPEKVEEYIKEKGLYRKVK
ncbi:MAG TPA: nicotinate (nicotinamide) nucleotide adenylyltransferase [Aquifex aeolicus]|nr:nicotinate (nicotinamide) nucleotide adenylyltransferase [Aquifex aeolicus]